MNDDLPSDPVLVRRARIARFVRRTKSIGYALLGLAIASFAAGLATSFASPFAGLTIGSLIASTVILPVPIVLGYGIRAAEREDRRSIA